jgi:hypothetical protein
MKKPRKGRAEDRSKQQGAALVKDYKLKREDLCEEEFYTYLVFWSENDEEYVGQCLEFPSLSFLDASYINALHGILGLIEEALIDLRKNGEVPPAPMSAERRGVVLRQMHQAMAQEQDRTIPELVVSR